MNEVSKDNQNGVGNNTIIVKGKKNVVLCMPIIGQVYCSNVSIHTVHQLNQNPYYKAFVFYKADDVII